jgi:hypothetical protein
MITPLPGVLVATALPLKVRLCTSQAPGSLKGWGVERDGVIMGAIEYAQKHWNEFREEYPEMPSAIPPDDIQVK